MKRFLFVLICLQSFNAWSDPQDKLSLGVDLFETGKYKEAFQVLEPIASEGNGFANYYIAMMYDPEFNKEPYPNSVKGSLKVKLSSRHANGNAEMYYKRAIDAGVTYGYFRLSEYYGNMFGFNKFSILADRNKRKARKKLPELVEKGDWRAYYMFALSQRSGSKTKHYAEETITVLEKHAKKGDRQAQFYLAKSLFLDLCEIKTCGDIAKAFAWFYVSGAQGSYHAKRHLQRLMTMMNDDELAEGKKLAAEFMKKYTGKKTKPEATEGVVSK